MVTEFIDTFKNEVNRLLVEQEYNKKKAEINTIYQNDVIDSKNDDFIPDYFYQEALNDLEKSRIEHLNSYDYFAPQNNYALPDFNTYLLSTSSYAPLATHVYDESDAYNYQIPDDAGTKTLSIAPARIKPKLNDYFSVEEIPETDDNESESNNMLFDPNFSFDDMQDLSENESVSTKETMEKLTDEITQTNSFSDTEENKEEKKEEEKIDDNHVFITDTLSIDKTHSDLNEADEILPDEPIEIINPPILSEKPQSLLSTLSLQESNEPELPSQTEQMPIQSQESAQPSMQTLAQSVQPTAQKVLQPIQQLSASTQAAAQMQAPIQQLSASTQAATPQQSTDVLQPSTFYKTNISPQQKTNEQVDSFLHEQKKNMMVRIAEWIQNNIFDLIGDHIPVIGTVIKMIGNVLTGLFKTIGNLFDGNYKTALSDGLSWLKDSAIIGGSAFGIYKLGKEFNWWGNKKESTTSVLEQDVIQDTVQGLVQGAITNAVTQSASQTTQNLISGIATPVSEDASTDVISNLLIGKINQSEK